MIDMNKKYRTIDGDELIRLLYKGVADLDEQQDAADRIEQLAATCEELEAKLAKAMAALEGVQGFVRDLEPYAGQGHTLAPALREACETLKELKGETE